MLHGLNSRAVCISMCGNVESEVKPLGLTLCDTERDINLLVVVLLLFACKRKCIFFGSAHSIKQISRQIGAWRQRRHRADSLKACCCVHNPCVHGLQCPRPDVSTAHCVHARPEVSTYTQLPPNPNSKSKP